MFPARVLLPGPVGQPIMSIIAPAGRAPAILRPPRLGVVDNSRLDRPVCQPAADMVSSTTSAVSEPVTSRNSGSPACGGRSGQRFRVTGRLQSVNGQRWHGDLVADEATVELPMPMRIAAVRRHHPFARPVRRLFLLALAACLVIACVSVVGYLTAPGTDP